ncbi:MAG: helix-turn-helix domain-containing protein [Albidovulum sp.]|nr:helix-turn-helix domain-containing protein [Albidovulum sp.]
MKKRDTALPAAARPVYSGDGPAGGMSTRREIEHSGEDRERLERVAGNPGSLQKHVWRARIILDPGSSRGLAETMRRTGKSKPTVRRWRDRFLAEGVDRLLRDAARQPGKRPIPEEKAEAAVDLAMPPPPERARHWTVRALAERLAMVSSSARNILRSNGPGPHRAETFKVSRDPRFEIKARDVATGKVAGRMAGRHRSAEFLAFPDRVAEGIEPETPVHVILDSVSSRKSAEVGEWLKGRPGWTFHFAPTSASRMNAVEGFFSKLSRRRPKNSIFNSLDECVGAIEGCIERRNANDARPFRWNRKPEDLAEAWKRGRRKLQEEMASIE